MQLKIKYFGQLAEITNLEEETLDISKAIVSELLSELYVKYPDLKEKEFKVAQDLKIVSEDSRLTATEIALLPPFSGG